MSTNGNGSGGAGNGGNAPSGGPKSPITDSLSKPLPKRFYKDVSVGEGAFFQVLLDGRPIKTPGKKALMLPTRALADLVVSEWSAQATHIDPSTMPLTRFSNTAIDAVSAALDDVAADIVAYAGRDLLCYRASDQPQLAQQQAARWDPVLAWAGESLGARFDVAEGVMPIDQPAATLKAFARALEPHDPYRLTALHVMTTLTGSAILALARARGALDAAQAWAVAHVDEDYQIALWGDDYEAAVRRGQRKAEFDAASSYLEALKPVARG
jgi:chaperone required for assembly of F1-ATPase